MTRDQRLILTIAVLASFVAFLDGSVINVALPAIGEDLGGGLTTQQWVVDAYLITLGSLILVAGSLSDVYGRVLVLRWGLVGFGLTSVLCAVAPTAEILIVARGLQGVAGALLVPSSLALILSAFRGAAQAKAIGTWTAWTSGAFIAGPILGGLFVDFLSWRLVFGINVVPIAVTLVLLAMVDHRDTRDRSGSVDLGGAVLGVVGIGAPVFALIEQANFGWSSPVVVVPLVVGIASFVAFVWRQRVAREPMMPLSLFRVRNFTVGNIATFFVYAALSLGGFIVAVFLQQSAGYSATLAGAAFVPVTFMNIALSTLFGSLAGRYGPRLFMSVGPMVAGIGYLLMLAIDEDAPYLTTVLPGVLVFGLGLSITVAPLTAAILGSISERQAGIGSAVNNAVSRVAGLIAVAVVGVIVGAQLDVEGLHRGLVWTAALLFAGGTVSAIGIRRTPSRSAPTTGSIPLPEHPQR
ncbi:MFS transporter [Marisediminicola sp. LYQ134]|uniref:MFS transporter n=1 Tax=Marisediminicola sp. LYQ134 TaxID=3391061 RepID=UPI00398325C7